MRLLARREYCAAEIRHRLNQRQCDPDCVENVLARLKKNGYLSEARFAAGFLRSRLHRGETPWLAARKARQRGVDESVLQDALDDAEATFDGPAACRELLYRRDPRRLRLHDERIWQRHARFLRNKGYDAATILRCLNEPPGQTEEK